MSEPVLLVTCFEPFGGSSRNASQEAVRLLPERIAGCTVEKRLLPVLWDAVLPELERLLRETRPLLLLATGQAGPEPLVHIERLGINLACGMDNAGRIRDDEPLLPGEPAAFFTTLPYAAMLRRLTAEGIPARYSYHAGTYLCNCALYTALHLAARHFPALRTGFLHVPSLPEDGSGVPFPPEQAARAIRLCLEEAVAFL